MRVHVYKIPKSLNHFVMSPVNRENYLNPRCVCETPCLRQVHLGSQGQPQGHKIVNVRDM